MATYAAVSFVALGSTLPGGSVKTLDAALQLARASQQSYKSHWKDSADDKGTGDMPTTGHGQRHHNGGFKTDAGGYNPQRVRRFWSHYHGRATEPKEKPLEKQPREAK